MGILAGAAALMFFLVYSVGAPLQGLLEEYVVTRPSEWLANSLTWAPEWVTGLLGGAGWRRHHGHLRAHPGHLLCRPGFL